MANQIVVSAGAKVRNLSGVLTATSGVVSSVPLGAANGVATLDSGGKVPVSQLPSSVVTYLGTWNAATNTPTLVNGTGDAGDMYLCNVAGTVNFGAGPVTFAVGDWVLYGSGTWQKSNGQNGTVTSVAVTESGDSLNITGSPITTSGTINIGFNGTNLQYVNGAGNLTTFPTLITSIGLSMPSAFSVANSPLTANGTIAVTGAGVASQYIRGDGTLADFPSSGGGGSSVSYYLNGGTSQGTILGTTYYEMSKIADTGTGVDFTKSGDGLIVSFLTDANDPAQLNIPAGNWNYEIYASMSSNGGTPQLYAELYVYNGTTFTLISTSSNEILYDGTNLNLYSFAMTVPATTLALTDRLAVKLYATNSGGKTTTVHTQDSHLCQIMTTFSTGITALNGLTAQVQYFQTGTSGTDFNISSATATHTFNLPTASATNRGALSSSDWSVFNGKQAALNGTGFVKISGTTISYDNSTYLTTAAASTTYLPMILSATAKAVDINGQQFSIYGTASSYTSGRIIVDPFFACVGYQISGLFDGLTISTDGSALFSNSGITRFMNQVRFDSTLTNGTYTYNLPSASGTLALVGSLGSYVPYTGATGNVDLGGNTIYADNFIIQPSGYSILASLTRNLTGSGFGALLLRNGSNATIQPTTLTVDRTYTLPDASGTIALVGGSGIGTVTSVGLSSATSGVTIGSSPVTTSGTITIAIATATTSQNGLLSSTDWTTFNSKGSGTVTSVAALTIGTSGTDLSSSVATGTTTPVITLNVPTASATNRGALSSSDWTTFNSKASTASLANYLPLGGGTMTGAIVGTTSTFTNAGSGIGVGITLSGASGDGLKVTHSAGRALNIASSGSGYGIIISNDIASTSIPFTIQKSGSNVITMSDTGAANFTGQLTLGSTITNGSSTYTLPSSSGTLALTSAIPTNPVGGIGTQNYITKWNNAGGTTIGNSIIQDDGTNVSVGYTTNPSLYKLDVNGTARFSSNLTLGAIGGGSGTATPLTINLTSTFSTTAGSNLKLKLFEDTLANIYGIGVSSGQMDFNVPTGASYRFYTGAATFSGTVYTGGATTASGLTGASELIVQNEIGIQCTDTTGPYLRMVAGSVNQDFTFVVNALSGTIPNLLFNVNSAERMRITGAGNVLIGTPTDSGYKLDVNGTGRFSGDLSILKSSGAYATITTDATTGVNFIFKQGGVVKHEIYTNTTQFAIYNTTTSAVALGIANATGAATFSSSVTATGLSLITAGSTAALIQGTGTTAYSSLSFQNTTTGYGYDIGFGGSASIAPNSFYIYGGSSATVKLAITSGGVVLVNQTTLSAASAGTKMQVNADILSTGTSAGYFWENRSGGVTTNTNWYGWYAVSGTIYLYNGSANVASISPSTGVYTPLSDINKKKDFEQSTLGLNAILGLKPTLYRMKSDETNGNKELGFIAQEVKEFIPQAYIESADFIGLNYNAIVTALVKSVQEQQAQIEELKQIVATINK